MFFTALAGRAGVSWLPVLMEKLKVEPMVREKVKALPWLASVWPCMYTAGEKKKILHQSVQVILSLKFKV